MATFGGTSFLDPKSNSKSPIRRTFLSTIATCSRGHSGAAFSIIEFIFSRLARTPSTNSLVNLLSSIPGANSFRFASSILPMFASLRPLKSHSKRDCIATDLARCLFAIFIFQDCIIYKEHFSLDFLSFCALFLCKLFLFFLPLFFVQLFENIYNLPTVVIPAIRADLVRHFLLPTMPAFRKIDCLKRLICPPLIAMPGRMTHMIYHK